MLYVSAVLLFLSFRPPLSVFPPRPVSPSPPQPAISRRVPQHRPNPAQGFSLLDGRSFLAIVVCLKLKLFFCKVESEMPYKWSWIKCWIECMYGANTVIAFPGKRYWENWLFHSVVVFVGSVLSYSFTFDAVAVEWLQNHMFPLVDVVLLASTNRLGMTDNFLQGRKNSWITINIIIGEVLDSRDSAIRFNFWESGNCK